MVSDFTRKGRKDHMLEINERVGFKPKVVNEPEVIIRVKDGKKIDDKVNNQTTKAEDPKNVQQAL